MIQAFKCTLEEIAHADLVIHLRDCSHPHHDLQKISVLRILEEMGFGKAFQEERMLEVWNKIDLVTEVPGQETAISCLTGKGMLELSKEIQLKLQKIKGMVLKQVEYGVENHGDVMLWLKENTNHSHNVQTQYNYKPSALYPNGSVKIEIHLDEAATGKLDKFLNPDRKKEKRSKGMPPKQGW